jgi:hypothetical protein
MTLRTTPEPLYMEMELRYGVWSDLSTPPTSYSQAIEIDEMTLTPAEQDSVRVTGRNISTRGRTLLSLKRPTGTPAQLQLMTLTYSPDLLALSMGGAVSEVTQTAGGIVSAEVTLAVGVAVPIPGRYLAESSFVVGTGDSADIGVEGSNTGLTITALEPTADGGSGLTITIVDPATPSQDLAVTVTGSDISVSLATDGSGDETSTAAEVLAAINADTDASALVIATHTGTSTGAGTMPAVAEATLSGGALVSASAYSVDAEGGFVLASTSAAAGTQRVYAETEAAVSDRYSGGDALDAYHHWTGTALQRATGKRGRLDIWQANLGSTAPIVAPQDDDGFMATLAGDMLTPAVAVQGIMPTRAFEFDDRRS